jgi:hypothetical protein
MLLLVLQPANVLAQTEEFYAGRWESTNQRFRLIIYRHQGALQILFYGQDQIGDGHNQYVTRAKNIRQVTESLLFELPPHSLYSNRQHDTASAGHQSELPALGLVEDSTPWRLKISQGRLNLDCSATERKVCGLRQPVDLHPIQ